jgi:hypothetical protein
MDNVTKSLLAAIALGLWANAAVHMTQPAKAQSSRQYTDTKLIDGINNINNNLNSIDTSLAILHHYMEQLLAGKCLNTKLCSGP